MRRLARLSPSVNKVPAEVDAPEFHLTVVGRQSTDIIRLPSSAATFTPTCQARGAEAESGRASSN